MSEHSKILVAGGMIESVFSKCETIDMGISDERKKLFEKFSRSVGSVSEIMDDESCSVTKYFSTPEERIAENLKSQRKGFGVKKHRNQNRDRMAKSSKRKNRS